MNFAAKIRRSTLALAFGLAGVLAPALHVHHDSLAANSAAEAEHCSHLHQHRCSHDHSTEHAAHDHTAGQHPGGHPHAPAHHDDCAACKLLTLATTMVVPVALAADQPLVEHVSLTVESELVPGVLGPSLARAPPALA